MSAVKKKHRRTPFSLLSHTHSFFSLAFSTPFFVSTSLISCYRAPRDERTATQRVLAQEGRPVSLVMALCFCGDRCVRSERTAVFVRKCLDGVQSPNEAQVLMATRGVFHEPVLDSECVCVDGGAFCISYMSRKFSRVKKKRCVTLYFLSHHYCPRFREFR